MYLKKFLYFFHSGSYYDFHFTIKELTKEFEKKMTCLGENTEKYMTLRIPREKEVIETKKQGNEIKQLYPTDHNLLIVQYLWQVHYQILLIEFIESNINMGMIIKNVKHPELITKIVGAFWNTQTLKII